MPLGATTRFDASRFAGDWEIAARFGATPQGAVFFAYGAARNTMALSGDIPAIHAEVYDIRGAGVLAHRRDADRSLVVMWVDEGFRTAAIGTVSGDFGVILNRSDNVAIDRMAAAREVLDFYGWDIDKLKGTGS